MEPIERLIAVEEIKKLKARYFRAVDTKDRTLLRGVFTDDAIADYRGAATDPTSGLNAVPGNTDEVKTGADTITDGVMESVAKLVTVHHGHTPEITVVDAHNASGIWPMVDILRMPADSAITDMIGWGHYHETYRKEGGQWKIATLRLTRIRVDITTRQ